MVRIFRFLAVVGCLLLPTLFTLPAAADTVGKTIFYNLTTDEAWTAGMALGQATKALESGYRIAVFLNVRGVLLASKAFHSDTWAGADKNLQDMLRTVLARGGRVIVCPMCLKKVGLGVSDVIDGAELGGPDVTLKTMTADDTVVISF